MVQPKATIRTSALRTYDPDEMTDEEYRGHFGQTRSTDDYVAMARRQLAQSPPAAGVPGAVLDAATEAAISRILGPDLTASVLRLFPGMSLSSWVSREAGGSIEALQRELLRHKVAGSPLKLSMHSMDAKAADAIIIGLGMNRR